MGAGSPIALVHLMYLFTVHMCTYLQSILHISCDGVMSLLQPTSRPQVIPCLFTATVPLVMSAIYESWRRREMQRCRDRIMLEMKGKAKRGRIAVLEIARSRSILSRHPHLFASLVAVYPEINADAGDHPECPPVIIGRQLNDIMKVRHSCVKKCLGLPCVKATCK